MKNKSPRALNFYILITFILSIGIGFVTFGLLSAIYGLHIWTIFISLGVLLLSFGLLLLFFMFVF